MFWLVCASFAGGIKAEKTRLMGLKVPDTIGKSGMVGGGGRCKRLRLTGRGRGEVKSLE